MIGQPAVRVRSAIHGATSSVILAAASLVLVVAVPAGAQSPAVSSAPDISVAATMAPTDSPVANDEAFVVGLIDFAVVPEMIEVARTDVHLSITNDGITPHNLSIRDEAGTVLAATPDMRQGETSELVFTAPGPGTYITFCSLPGHESLGFRGILVIEGLEPEASAPPDA